LGSLIIAILELIMYMLREMAHQNNLAAAVAHCIIGCIKGLIEYLNAFAYVEVAIYGKGFCEAAKDAWGVITGNGFGVLVSDIFVGRALGVAVFTTGFVTATIAYLWGVAAFSTGSIAFAYNVGVSFICFAFGMMCMWTVAKAIDAGVRTILVCVAEDPAALQRTKPELYAGFKQNFPEIAWRV
jgi:hypothetical protein